MNEGNKSVLRFTSDFHAAIRSAPEAGLRNQQDLPVAARLRVSQARHTAKTFLSRLDPSAMTSLPTLDFEKVYEAGSAPLANFEISYSKLALRHSALHIWELLQRNLGKFLGLFGILMLFGLSVRNVIRADPLVPTIMLVFVGSFVAYRQQVDKTSYEAQSAAEARGTATDQVKSIWVLVQREKMGKLSRELRRLQDELVKVIEHCGTEVAARLSDRVNKMSLAQNRTNQIVSGLSGVGQSLGRLASDVDTHIAELEETVSQFVHTYDVDARD